MNDLVIMKNKQAVTTSLQVAETFEKGHQHILRNIDGLKKDVSNFGQMFLEGNEPDSYGRDRRTYFMNRDGFTLLAMGFTGKKALKFKLQYIEAFNQMEQSQPMQQYQIPRTLPEALRLAADQAETIETQNKQIEHDRPLALYTEVILKNPGLTKASVIAKNYGLAPARFNELLHQLRIQYRQGKDWMLYAKYQNKGYTHSEPFEFTHSNGVKDVKNNMKWTQAGQKFLYDKLKEVGIVPVIERGE